MIPDENTPPSIASTPSTARFKDALATPPPSTPKHRVRLTGRLFTPVSSRLSTPTRSQNVYAQARQLFTQASNGSIIGRDAERLQLRKFISNALENKVGGCTYVSGPPGTGKSALVQEILQELEETATKVATFNCVAFKSSAEVLASFAQEFGCSTGNQKALKERLSRIFTTKKANPELHVVLLDEIDSLVEGQCEVLYSIFEWAMHPSSSLILIGIANALDLTDRFLPRLKSRNVRPELLPFLPYSAAQISTILSEKLRSLLAAGNSSPENFVPLIHPAAIQLIAKRIASQSSDLRKAFTLARRAIDQIEQETLLKLSQEQAVTPTKQPLADIPNLGSVQGVAFGTKTPTRAGDRSVLCHLTAESAPRATPAHVAAITSNIFNNATLSRLDTLNLQQKAVLCSLVASENHRKRRDPFTTPSKSMSKTPTITGLFAKYAALCKRHSQFVTLRNTEFRDVVASLETLGLVQEAIGRGSSLLTPTKTPSRSGRGMDDKQVVSAVSEKEMRDSLRGPGAGLLLNLFEDP